MDYIDNYIERLKKEKEELTGKERMLIERIIEDLEGIQCNIHGDIVWNSWREN